MPRLTTTRTYSPTQLTRALVAHNLIQPTSVRGRYTIQSVDSIVSYRRGTVLEFFATEVRSGRWSPTQTTMNRIGVDLLIRGLGPFGEPVTVAPERDTNFSPTPEPVAATPPPLRRLSRLSYHSGDRNVEQALERIAPDVDGVRRSYGLEYEIGSLAPQQEDKLCNLLDTLPPHLTETDGSLSYTGVEIVFEPMSEEKYIYTFNKLTQFVQENNIDMCNTGAHTTYGVNNGTVSVTDLRTRLNRYALAVKAVGTQRNIIELFGRDFSNYCQLPTSTTTRQHSNAFSNHTRGNTCWELRLMSYKADIIRIIEFFKATETVFHRPTNSQDFIKVFEILGATTDGE